jgi:rod shape-determining protein MreD
MKLLPHCLLLGATWLLAFLPCVMDWPQRWLGAQASLLPPLIVYAALSCTPGWMMLLALAGGMWADALSCNPLGSTTAPLLLIGMVVLRNREVILRKETFAQVTLGLAASAAAPLLQVLLLLTFGYEPLVSWASLWPWVFMTVAGGALTPWLFRGLDRLLGAVTYPTAAGHGWPMARDIVRGRH